MYRYYLPAKPLQPFIECYWMLRLAPGAAHTWEEYLTVDAQADILFNFGSPYLRHLPNEIPSQPSPASAHLNGLRQQALSVTQFGDIHLVAVRFRPGGVAAFLRLQVAELVDQTVDLQHLFRASIVRDMEAQLYDHADQHGRQVASLDAFFLAHLAPPANHKIVEVIAAHIAVSGGGISIHTLCTEFGYSIRTLDRHFQQVFGVSPKFYARLVRFQRAVALITANPHRTLLDIVFTCGYFDQAHFSRDFKAFSGQSPDEYRRTTLQKFAYHQNYVQFLQEQMSEPLYP